MHSSASCKIAHAMFNHHKNIKVSPASDRDHTTMRFLTVLLCCSFAVASGGWLRDLLSEGWHLGDGVFVHLAESRHPNASFFERHSIMMDYRGFGVAVSKVPDKRALELDLYSKQGEERGHKDTAVSLIVGYKVAALVAVGLSMMGALVLKALIAAKIAVIISTVLLVSKLFHKSEKKSHPEYVEFDQIPEVYPEFSEFPPSGAEYIPASSSNYYAYANYSPGVDHAETSNSNSSVSESSNQQVARRKDSRRRIPLLTIHHTVKT